MTTKSPSTPGSSRTGGLPPPPSATATFALTPALTNASAILDYSTTIGHKIYQAATAALANPFDCSARDSGSFREQLLDRAVASGWGEGRGDILEVNKSDGTTRNVITNYGELTPAEIKADALARYVGLQTRAAQNSN